MPRRVRLTRAGTGVYTLKGREDLEVQNPHLMDPSDPDKHWYVVSHSSMDTYGPFDTLREIREFLADGDPDV